MKNLFLSLVVASTGFASDFAEIKVEKTAQLVQVNSATYTIVGERGFPSVEVKGVATFGNECMVPDSDELVKMVEFSRNFDGLKIHLGETSNRICPAVFRPTQVVLNLGQFTRPNDGLFSSIRVNGKIATKAN